MLGNLCLHMSRVGNQERLLSTPGKVRIQCKECSPAPILRSPHPLTVVHWPLLEMLTGSFCTLHDPQVVSGSPKSDSGIVGLLRLSYCD